MPLPQRLLKIRRTNCCRCCQGQEIQANKAGKFYCLFSSIDSKCWILDTGPTNHMTHNHKWLFKAKKFQYTKVHLPNGIHYNVENIGNYKFLNKELQNVLHIPDFKFNLLSVLKLTADLLCSITFLAKIVVLQDLSTGMVLGTGKESVGLCLINFIDTNTNDSARNELMIENSFF